MSCLRSASSHYNILIHIFIIARAVMKSKYFRIKNLDILPAVNYFEKLFFKTVAFTLTMYGRIYLETIYSINGPTY